MTQEERRLYLIRYLLEEGGYSAEVPTAADDQKKLLRALMNVRAPGEASPTFLAVQDDYLAAATAAKGITDAATLPYREDMTVWQGDITTLKADAIVNAANSALLGCFVPGHHCIDNAIHTFAGIQLRLACDAMMRRQGAEEPTGRAKITEGYNLPCRYVLHTVGPIVQGRPTPQNAADLASCYTECLALADRYHLGSVAFCCISTGVFGYPNREAAEVAVEAVRRYKRTTGSTIKVIFNVWKDIDYAIYHRLLD